MQTYIIDFPQSLSKEEKTLLNDSLKKLINNYFLYMKSFKLTNTNLVLCCEENIYNYIHNILNFLNII